tara:strand:- start:2898 stop:3149 length:252 start_codon:yes stop_codon:yes gene_type:complete
MAATSRAHQKQTGKQPLVRAAQNLYNVYLNKYLADMINISHKKTMVKQSFLLRYGTTCVIDSFLNRQSKPDPDALILVRGCFS